MADFPVRLLFGELPDFNPSLSRDNAMISFVDMLVSKFLQEKLTDLLVRLTAEQRYKFWQINPVAVREMTEVQLRSALDLCHRTHIKNMEEKEKRIADKI